MRKPRPGARPVHETLEGVGDPEDVVDVHVEFKPGGERMSITLTGKLELVEWCVTPETAKLVERAIRTKYGDQRPTL